MQHLKSILDSLWANVVDKWDIDIFNHKITFLTRAIENGIVTNNEIIFNQVSSFYFVEDIGESRIHPCDPESDDYLELSSIAYHQGGVGLIKIKSDTENWVKQYKSNANFSLEHWN